MSHYIVELEKLKRRPYGFGPKRIGDTLFDAVQNEVLRDTRPDLPLVYGFSSDRKAEMTVKSMINRSATPESPFKAALLFVDKPELAMVAGFCVVNRHVRLIERPRNGLPNVAVGPYVDTTSIVLFDGSTDSIQSACAAVTNRFELERPVAIEPETSSPEVQKALLEFYGPGTQGNFAVGLNGRAILATAFGLTI